MMLTTQEAALIAGVDDATIRQWVTRRHLRRYSSWRVVNGRARRVNTYDERELLLAERATRLRGGLSAARKPA